MIQGFHCHFQIQTRRRFVCYDQVRIMHDGCGDQNTSCHSSRQLKGVHFFCLFI
ncbi:hypothetical protein EVA_09126 [gut metagenome]|uniref:Uncharacterized protein n=1 Tax=gut metagenome TaxID=749906 RepID=J9CRF8_9ZZZZ